MVAPVLLAAPAALGAAGNAALATGGVSLLADSKGVDTGKGDSGPNSTDMAVMLAQQLSKGTLDPTVAARLPENFGKYQWGDKEGQYIFGEPPQGGYTSSTDPADIQQAQSDLNRIDMANPFGASGYSVDENGNVVLSSEFSPELQGLFGQITDIAGGQGQAQTQVFDQAMRMIEPVIANERANLAASLEARGIPRGSEIWNREMQAQQLREEDLYSRAATDAISTGAGLEQQQFSQIAALLSGMPTSPFQPIDVTGSFGPSQNKLAMLLQKQMTDDAQETNERGQIIGGVSNVVGSFLGR